MPTVCISVFKLGWFRHVHDESFWKEIVTMWPMLKDFCLPKCLEYASESANCRCNSKWRKTAERAQGRALQIM